VVLLNVPLNPAALPPRSVNVESGEVTPDCLVAVMVLLPEVNVVLDGVTKFCALALNFQPDTTPVAVQLTLIVAVPPPEGAVTVGATQVTAGIAKEGLTQKQNRNPNKLNKKRFSPFRLNKSRFTERYPSFLKFFLKNLFR
jgi:hypothetical protein